MCQHGGSLLTPAMYAVRQTVATMKGVADMIELGLLEVLRSRHELIAPSKVHTPHSRLNFPRF